MQSVPCSCTWFKRAASPLSYKKMRVWFRGKRTWIQDQKLSVQYQPLYLQLSSAPACGWSCFHKGYSLKGQIKIAGPAPCSHTLRHFQQLCAWLCSFNTRLTYLLWWTLFIYSTKEKLSICSPNKLQVYSDSFNRSSVWIAMLQHCMVLLWERGVAIFAFPLCLLHLWCRDLCVSVLQCFQGKIKAWWEWCPPFKMTRAKQIFTPKCSDGLCLLVLGMALLCFWSLSQVEQW